MSLLRIILTKTFPNINFGGSKLILNSWKGLECFMPDNFLNYALSGALRLTVFYTFSAASRLKISYALSSAARLTLFYTFSGVSRLTVSYEFPGASRLTVFDTFSGASRLTLPKLGFDPLLAPCVCLRISVLTTKNL